MINQRESHVKSMILFFRFFIFKTIIRLCELNWKFEIKFFLVSARRNVKYIGCRV